MAGTDQYGYQPSTLAQDLEKWNGGQERTVADQGSTRIRLELSTTTRGWDYSGTVEIVAPGTDLTDDERQELVNQAHTLQMKLREAGSSERDKRNQLDRLGPYAPPKATGK